MARLKANRLGRARGISSRSSAQLDGARVERVLVGERAQLALALGPLVALRQAEHAVVVGPEQLDVVVGQRARVGAAGERGQLVAARGLALGVEERPLLVRDARDAGGGGHQDGLLLEGQRHRVGLRAVGQRARELRAQGEAPRTAGEDRLQGRERRGLARGPPGCVAGRGTVRAALRRPPSDQAAGSASRSQSVTSVQKTLPLGERDRRVVEDRVLAQDLRRSSRRRGWPARRRQSVRGSGSPRP